MCECVRVFGLQKGALQSAYSIFFVDVQQIMQVRVVHFRISTSNPNGFFCQAYEGYFFFISKANMKLGLTNKVFCTRKKQKYLRKFEEKVVSFDAKMKWNALLRCTLYSAH